MASRKRIAELLRNARRSQTVRDKPTEQLVERINSVSVAWALSTTETNSSVEQLYQSLKFATPS